jgi:hypothetical protein
MHYAVARGSHQQKSSFLGHFRRIRTGSREIKQWWSGYHPFLGVVMKE